MRVPFAVGGVAGAAVGAIGTQSKKALEFSKNLGESTGDLAAKVGEGIESKINAMRQKPRLKTQETLSASPDQGKQVNGGDWSDKRCCWDERFGQDGRSSMPDDFGGRGGRSSMPDDFGGRGGRSSILDDLGGRSIILDDFGGRGGHWSTGGHSYHNQSQRMWINSEIEKVDKELSRNPFNYEARQRREELRLQQTASEGCVIA